MTDEPLPTSRVGDELSEEERVWARAHEAAGEFSEECRRFHRDAASYTKPYPDFYALNEIINTLMTELWDRGFSQRDTKRLRGGIERYESLCRGRGTPKLKNLGVVSALGNSTVNSYL